MQDTIPVPLDGVRVNLLKVSGDTLVLAAAIQNEMRIVQSALLGGDVRAAHKAFDRGKRMSAKLLEIYNEDLNA